MVVEPRGGVVRRDARSAGWISRAIEGSLQDWRERADGGCALQRRHPQAVDSARRWRRDRERDYPDRGSDDALYIEPGRVRDGLRILCDRTYGTPSESRGGRDIGAVDGGAHRIGTRRDPDELRFHGYGRAAGELSAAPSRADDYDRRLGSGNLAAANYGVHGRAGASNGTAACGLPGEPGGLAPRDHRRGARSDRADQPALSAAGPH